MKRVIYGLLAALLIGTAGCRKEGGPPPSGDEEALSSAPTTMPPTTPPAPSTAAPTVPTEPPRAETVTLTFKEGDSLTKIFQKLEAGGVTTAAKLMEAARTLDVSGYPLAAAMPADGRRPFRLEGYLFPDTYEFYVGERPDRVLRRMLQNTENRITGELREQAVAQGRSMDEILTIASVIQREGSKASEMPKIAGILYNRLRDGMRLQMDGTTDYLERQVKPYLTGDTGRYDGHYDTYKISGLPAGPICSPGLGAVRAALKPAQVSYLYFCNDAQANYYYADTYAEHLDNLVKAGLRPAGG